MKCQQGEDDSTAVFTDPFRVKIECDINSIKDLDPELFHQKRNSNECAWRMPIDAITDTPQCMSALENNYVVSGALIDQDGNDFFIYEGEISAGNVFRESAGIDYYVNGIADNVVSSPEFVQSEIRVEKEFYAKFSFSQVTPFEYQIPEKLSLFCDENNCVGVQNTLSEGTLEVMTLLYDQGYGDEPNTNITMVDLIQFFSADPANPGPCDYTNFTIFNDSS